ncbi:MAG: hypothetical protein DLM67_22845 [Candidatus Nephthysia bennettiae]|nr:MAG: hypothetical protein DLM67_22845 [Candidatus Dormibacteraeota bacterium]
MKALLGRLKNSFPGRLAKAYGESKAGNYAAGLAFNAFMTMFPLMLGLLAILGLVINNSHVRDQAMSTLLGIFPADAGKELSAALKGVQQHSGLLGLISVVGLLWSGTGLFAGMEFALGEMFGAKQRDMVRQRLMALVMVAIFLVAMLLAVVSNSAVAATGSGLKLLGPVLSTVVLIVMMALIYRIVPNRTFPSHRCCPGRCWRGS